MLFLHNGCIVTIDHISFVSPIHSMIVDHLTFLNVPCVQVVTPLPHVNYVELSPMPSIADEKEPLFSCSSYLDSSMVVGMVTPSLEVLEPDLPLISLSEFLDMYSFQNVILPSDEDLLEAMVKIDALIVDLVFPQDVVPHQEPSFPSPTQLDPISSSLLGEHILISIQGPTWGQKMSH